MRPITEGADRARGEASGAAAGTGRTREGAQVAPGPHAGGETGAPGPASKDTQGELQGRCNQGQGHYAPGQGRCDADS